MPDSIFVGKDRKRVNQLGRLLDCLMMPGMLWT